MSAIRRKALLLIPMIWLGSACAGGLLGLDRDDGCPDTDYPDWASSPYVLPIPVGETARIDLSQCSGSFHSEGSPDAYAIDFNMPIGSKVTASRPGVVVLVEESGFDGGFPNNRVVVDHGDQTYAQYMHLTHEGAVVEVGDSVEWGTLLGYSGATGLAGYPHLHFVVTKNWHEYPYVSTVVNFRNTAANPRSLVSGREYQALSY